MHVLLSLMYFFYVVMCSSIYFISSFSSCIASEKKPLLLFFFTLPFYLFKLFSYFTNVCSSITLFTSKNKIFIIMYISIFSFYPPHRNHNVSYHIIMYSFGKRQQIMCVCLLFNSCPFPFSSSYFIFQQKTNYFLTKRISIIII